MIAQTFGITFLAAFIMASNGLVFRPGRGPSFILVGLVLIVIILFYSYWGVSSKNNKLLRDVSVLQDRLRVLAARKLTADKKGSALLTRISQLEAETDKKDKAINSKDEKNVDLSASLRKKEIELSEFQQQEQNYIMELEKLRKGVNSSSSGLKTLKGKADQLLKSYQDIKANYSSLLQQITTLTSQRDLYQKELANVKKELEDLKKKTVDKVPTKPNNEGNKEPTRDDSEGGNTDEKKPDEPKKPVPSISETSKKAGNVNSSSAANVSDPMNIKSSGNKTQSEESAGSPTKSSTGILDRLKQGIMGGTDEDEKEVTRVNKGAQQPTEKSSPSDENSRQENEDEANDQEENEKKVMDKRQGQNTPINTEEKDMEEKEKTEPLRDQEDENAEENENVGNEDNESDKDVDDSQKDDGEVTETQERPLSRDSLQRKMRILPDSLEDIRGPPNSDNKQLPVGNSRQKFDSRRSRDTPGNLGVGRRMGRDDPDDRMMRK